MYPFGSLCRSHTYPLAPTHTRALPRFTSNFGVMGCFVTARHRAGSPSSAGNARCTSPARGSKWLPRSRHVRRRHPAQKPQQPLFPNRAERVAVEVEDVDVAHLHARLRRRQTERRRDIGQRPPFPPRGRLHLAEERGQVLGRGQIARLPAQGVERGASFLQRHRGHVDRVGQHPGAGLQPAQQLLVGRDVRVLRQMPRRFQLGDQRPQVGLRAAHDVGRGGQHPQRREADGEDAGPLQHIAGELARGQLLDRDLLVPIDVAHIADPLDHDAQQAIDGHLIELGLPQRARQRDIARLVDRAAHERDRGARHPLRQRDQVARNALAQGGIASRCGCCGWVTCRFPWDKRYRSRESES